MGRVRRVSRWLHRDLSYLFAGALLVYAISGICLNHKRDFNSDYSIRLTEYTLESPLPAEKDGWDKDYVLGLLEPLGERENYTQHYFPDEHTVKVFLKGGSSLQADIQRAGPVRVLAKTSASPGAQSFALQPVARLDDLFRCVCRGAAGDHFDRHRHGQGTQGALGSRGSGVARGDSRPADALFAVVTGLLQEKITHDCFLEFCERRSVRCGRLPAANALFLWNISPGAGGKCGGLSVGRNRPDAYLCPCDENDGNR